MGNSIKLQLPEKIGLVEKKTVRMSQKAMHIMSVLFSTWPVYNIEPFGAFMHFLKGNRVR